MIKPCGHRVLIKPLPTDDMTKGGIYIPPTEKEKQQRDQQRGTIVDVGKTAWKAFDRDDPNWEPWAKVGDLVMFSRYGGKTVYDGETEYRILNDEDIVAIVSEDITT